MYPEQDILTFLFVGTVVVMVMFLVFNINWIGSDLFDYIMVELQHYEITT